MDVQSILREVCEISNDEDAVDCHFIHVKVHELPASSLASLRSWVENPTTVFGEDENARERIPKGISYIEMGGYLGDQTLALFLFAVGAKAGWWKVVTPKTLGIEGSAADELAGGGLVMNSGLN